MAGFCEVTLPRERALALLTAEWDEAFAEFLLRRFDAAVEAAGKSGRFNNGHLTDLLTEDGAKMALKPWFGFVKIEVHGYSWDGSDVARFMGRHGIQKGGKRYELGYTLTLHPR